MSSGPSVPPVLCASKVSSVAAVDHSPGSIPTGSAVAEQCHLTDEVVDVAAAAAEGDRAGPDRPQDNNIASQLSQVSLQPWTGSSSSGVTQTVPARLHRQSSDSDARNQRAHQRTPLRNVFSCDTGIYTVIQKKGATITMAITLSILDRFAKFFHCCKEH